MGPMGSYLLGLDPEGLNPRQRESSNRLSVAYKV